MKLRRLMVLGALASCSLLVAGANARAAYTYTTTTPVASPATLPGLAGETFTPMSGTVPDANTVTVPLVSLAFTPTSSFTGGTQTLSWTTTLATVGGGPSETFSIAGTLAFGIVPGDGVATQFTVPSGGITSTGSGFTLTYAGYEPTSATSGNLNFALAIPEPASMALMGVGLVWVIGLGLRRSRPRARA